MTDVKKMHKELMAKGLSAKDAAKQIQAKTGLSAVSGQPINRQLYGKFSKKSGKILGLYGD